jgi:hypothetical protein
MMRQITTHDNLFVVKDKKLEIRMKKRQLGRLYVDGAGRKRLS